MALAVASMSSVRAGPVLPNIGGLPHNFKAKDTMAKSLASMFLLKEGNVPSAQSALNVFSGVANANFQTNEGSSASSGSGSSSSSSGSSSSSSSDSPTTSILGGAVTIPATTIPQKLAALAPNFTEIAGAMHPDLSYFTDPSQVRGQASSRISMPEREGMLSTGQAGDRRDSTTGKRQPRARGRTAAATWTRAQSGPLQMCPACKPDGLGWVVQNQFGDFFDFLTQSGTSVGSVSGPNFINSAPCLVGTALNGVTVAPSAVNIIPQLISVNPAGARPPLPPLLCLCPQMSPSWATTGLPLILWSQAGRAAPGMSSPQNRALASDGDGDPISCAAPERSAPSGACPAASWQAYPGPLLPHRCDRSVPVRRRRGHLP